MSVVKKAISGFSWFAGYRFLGQLFSWSITIIVARILVPQDYGLMEMSTIITGYAGLFSELGLGSAIVQRLDINKNELSSIFWFGLGNSLIFAIFCILIAYPTAAIFNEPRVIPITQTVSILFLLNGLIIVPENILRKNLDFKKIGFIEMSSIVVSSGCMVLIAYSGGGVWTLILGHIIRDSIKMVLTYWYTRWFPSTHYNFNEVKNFLVFGLAIAVGNSFRYLTDKSDRFFVGRVWKAQIVGYYGLALNLAQIPTEKIISLINQVSYSALSNLQENIEEFRKFYLGLSKVILTLTIPLYLGGFLVGKEMIILLLGEKWIPSIIFFKYLCLAQILRSIAPLNNEVHAAKGQSKWFLYFHVCNGILLPVSFYLSVTHSIYAILIPWFTVYPMVVIIWIYLCLKELNISVITYIKNIISPVAGALAMAGGVYLFDTIFTGSTFNLFIGMVRSTGINSIPNVLSNINNSLLILLITKILIGMIIYSSYFLVFDRKMIVSVKNLVRT